MKFLCLGYLDIEKFDAAPEEVRHSILTQCNDLCQTLRATGKVVAEEGLEAVARAKSIRPKSGRATVTDGPFIETKEQLGSYFVIEADSMDEAIRVASLHPAALLGEDYGFGVEVRPIQE